MLSALPVLALLFGLAAPVAAQTPTVPTLKVEIPTVTEGETGTIKLTLSQESSQSIDTQVSAFSIVCGSGVTCPQGATAAAASDYSLTSVTITFAPSETTKTVSFTTTDDSTSESTEVFQLAVTGLAASEATIDPSTPADGQGFGQPYWFVRIQDNDNPANPNVTITSGTSPVTEGTSATFTVTATPAPAATTTVSVAVTEETSGGQDFVASGNETTHTVTIPASGSPNAGTGTLTIATVGDSTQEPHGAVTATVSGGTGHTVGNPSSATVTVLDDDGTSAPPEVSVRLMTGEGENRNMAGEVEKPESDGTVSFPLSLDAQPSAALTVCVRVTESGDVDRVALADEGIKTVSFNSGVQTGSIDVAWTDTDADDLDSVITVTAVPSNTVGCSSTDVYTVSSTTGSDKVKVSDDEVTALSLASSDTEMGEGDASNTAVITVSLGRALISGESVVAPITLATDNGARLPGHATPDFAVAAMGTGVALSNATSATPRLTFTGSDSSTVQEATVTLTPVANRDDGDTDNETITATLSLLTGTGSGTVVTGGGVAVVQASSVATLTLEDDEAAPPPVTCSAQNPIFNDTSLRILETGETTYCVRLTTAPSGGDTTVTIGRIGGGATVSPASLTFTSSNYQTPQQVTVTGMDEPGSHRNRTTQLTHTASGGGYSSQNLGRVWVDVDDAPEVEAFWYIKGGAGGVRIRRPHTITSTRGLTAWQNAAPGDRLSYAVRLSNRPEPGGTVTVTATVPSDKRNLVGLSLTEGGEPENSVRVEFKDRSPGAGTGCSNWFGHQAHQYFDSHGNTRTVSGRQPSESYDGTPDTPWECWRMIYVVRKDASRNIDDTCADITHTATGGGVRKVTVDTIRAHVRNPGRNRRGSRGYDSQCRNLNGNTLSAPALAAPAPTEAVANLQVTAVDDTSASVTWDAVEHATSYDVSWSAESGDALNASAGEVPGVTGTATTIDHGASVAMTLTVTVTPEYIDKHGDTQQLASLAGTATLAVGPGSDALSASAESTDSQTPACVSDALLAEAQLAASETWRASDHVERWSRVLAAFGVENAWSSNPMTVAEAQAQADRGLKRWAPVAPALECLEKEPEEQAEQAEAQVSAAPDLPALTVTAGGDVTEGTAATFTLKADPVGSEELAVTVTVAQTGAVADASVLGERTVTLPAGEAQASFTVATLADETDEPAGTVVATVSDGTGYTVTEEGASAAVGIEDDDATTLVLSAPEGDLPEASGSMTLTLTLGRALVEGESLAVPLTFAGTAILGTDYTLSAPQTAPAGVRYAHLAGTDPKNPPTVTFAGAAGSQSASVATIVLTTVADGEAEGDGETVTVTPGRVVATGLGGGAAASGAVGLAILEPPPEVAIAAQSGTVVEGQDAVFTLTASRAPGADLEVSLAVFETEGSDVVAAEHEGAATATLLKGETQATFTVATVNDTVAEPEGTVTVALADGSGYEVAASPDDAASVTVTDDDAVASAPTLSVSDETAAEDVGLMYFTVRLDRAVTSKVKVTFTARESSPVSARQGEDWFWWWPDGIGITFWPGQTEKKMWVYIYNDNHDEDPETFEVVLSQPTGGAAIGDGVAVGTIVNSDPMPAAWLARFGRTVAEQALDGIAGRIAAPRTAGVEGTFAGQALNLDPGSQADGPAVHGAPGSLAGTDMLAETDVAFTGTGGTAEFGDDALGFDSGSGQSYAMTTAEVLLGSSFTATGEEDSHGGSLALWGRAAQSHFDGREGTFSLDGEATTAMLGADYARGTWLLGMALMQSTGEGDYTDTDVMPRAVSQMCEDPENGMEPDEIEGLCRGAVREGSGTVEATLTAVLPYAAVQASERLKLWGAAGHGTGDVTLKTEMDGVLTSDITWTMGAAGMRGDVIAAPLEGPALAVTSDALWARTSSAKTHELAASDSDVTRLRLGLEGSWRMALRRGGSVTPKLETGARHDGGDAETGFGVEMGGGLVWNDPGLGLLLDLSGRTLVAHGSDDLEDRGFAASLAFDPDPASALGPSLTLRQDWGGEATGGLDRLFTPETLEDRTGGAEDEIRWQADAAYGFPLFSGDFIGSPQAGLGLATGSREYSLGWQLTPGEGVLDLSFGLQATRRESEGAPAVHGVGLEVTLRW